MANFIVTTAEDELDSGFTEVDPGGFGLSLREAIALANQTAGDDTITFDDTVFTGGLSSLIRLTLGEIEITDGVIIDGSSGVDIVITGDANGDDDLISGSYITDVAASASALSDNSRIFNITDATATTMLSGLVLTGGYTSADSESGAAVNSDAALSIYDSTISGNSTTGDFSVGAGVHSEGDVTLENVTLSGNSTSGDNANGGAVNVQDASLTVTYSTVSDNSTSGVFSRGAGLYATGDITLTGSTVSGNSTSGNYSYAGGVMSRAAVTLTGSTVSGNSTEGRSGYGGGIYGASVDMTDSTVSDNSTSGYRGFGGGIFSRDITLNNSTVSGNSTTGEGARGGGVSGSVTMYGSTVSNNTTAGDSANGGGIRGSVTMVNSTMTGNSVLGDGSSGGAIYATSGQDVLLTNSIVLGNSSGSGRSEIGGAGGSAATYGGRNIVGEDVIESDGSVSDTTAATEVFDTTTELTDADGVGLGVYAGVLADNGGSVETVLLNNSSSNPALDAGEDSLAADADTTGLDRSVDIAGVANNGDNTSDLGALEYGIAAPVVDTLDDNDDGDLSAGNLSLREAISLAGDGSVITFDPTVFTGGANSVIRLTQGAIDITTALTIDGSTGTDVVITGDANGDDTTFTGTYITDVAESTGTRADNSNIFAITGDATLSDLTLTGGVRTDYFGAGGAVSVVDATVSIENSTISGNATTGEAGYGGGVLVGGSGDLTITGSTISDNMTFGDLARGGGLATNSSSAKLTLINSTVSGNATMQDYSSGGGIYGRQSTIDLTNTTVSGNWTEGASSFGGGIYLSFRGDLSLTHSTVTGNYTTGSGAQGGGIGAGQSVDVSLTNSIVAGNISVSSSGEDVSLVRSNATLNLYERNIVGSTLYDGSSAVETTSAAQIFAEVEDNNGVDAGVLAANGSPLETVALLYDVSNPALDGASGSTLTEDARGIERPFDIDGVTDVDTGSDLGAFELIDSIVVDTNEDEFDGDLSVGDVSLREAVAALSAGGTITFDASVFTGGENSLIRLTEGEIETSQSLTIDGTTGTDIVITGDAAGDDEADETTFVTDIEASDGSLSDNSRIFAFTGSDADIEISGLTLTGGYTQDGGLTGRGGGIYSAGDLTISDSAISGNATTGLSAGGGGIYSAGDLTLTDTTVSGNINSGILAAGGGVYVGGDLVGETVTVSDNQTTGSNAGGAGIFATSGSVSLTQATVSGNSASGVEADGGGIRGTTSITLIQSTVSGNSASTIGGYGGGVISTGTGGGGIDLTNSVVLGNYASGSGAEILQGSDITVGYSGGNIVGDAFSVDGVLTSSGITASQVFAETEDNNGVDAGVLGDNGGTVQTIALASRTDNTALDATDLAAGLSLDADGNTRSVELSNVDNGGAVDLGAVELQVDLDPESLIVTTNEDTVDLTDGVTSLREAIGFVNDGIFEAGSTIEFDPTVFTGGEDSVIRLLSGRIVISESVTIDGSTGLDVVLTGDASGDDVLVTGTYLTDIEASAGALYDNSRLFNINSADATTTISGVTLTGGYTYSRGVDGGAIRTLGDLTLSDVTLSGNGTRGNDAEGGAIYSTGTLSITDSSLSENLTQGSGAEGGAIFATGDVTLSNVTLSGNQTFGSSSSGGAVFSSGALSVSDSTISGNSTDGSSAKGGGIYAGDTLTVTDSLVTQNNTSGGSAEGGGINGEGAITLVNSTISDNTTEDGNAFGGGISGGSTVDVLNSTVSGNTTSGIGSAGGGIFGAGGITLVNATVSGNSTSGQLIAGGGGVYGVREVTLVNSTVTGNAIAGTLSEGGGVYSLGFEGYGLTISNSLVLGNYAGNADGADVAFQSAYGGTLSYEGGNIIGDVFSIDAVSQSTGITVAEVFAETEDNNGVVAGVLADNGGDVQTVALLNDDANLALDSGDDDLLPTEAALDADVDGDGTVSTTQISVDAIGSERFVDTADVDNNGANILDLGAVELGEDASLVVTTLEDVEANDGQTSLREAIGLIEDGTFEAGSAITFESDLSGGTIYLAEDLNQLQIDESMTIQGDIDGDGIGDITINANSAEGLDDADSRVFLIRSSGVALDGLTISGGYGKLGGITGSGAGIFIQGSAELALTNSTLTDNEAIGGGGGLVNFGTASLDNVNIYGNTASYGGGVHNRATLTLENSNVTSNYASGVGGGIDNAGDLDLSDTTISNNTASIGGGVYSSDTAAISTSLFQGNTADVAGGGIANPGDITSLVNSTFYGNRAGTAGGGLYGTGTADVTNSTFTGNSAETGGGIYMTGGATLTNTLVLGNTATTDSEVSGSYTNGSGNLVGDGDIAEAEVFAATTTVNNTVAGALADNGGTTQTVALLADAFNPALDTGDLSGDLSTDANGATRSVDQDVINNGGAVDAGATELQTTLDGPGLVVTTTEDVVDAFDGETSLREAIEAINSGFYDEGSVIRFAGDSDLTGDDATLSLTDASGTGTVYLAADLEEFVLTQSMTIDGDLDGDDVADITISADSSFGADDADSRIFDIAGGTAVLSSLILADGEESADDGGAVVVRDDAGLALTNSVVTGNTAQLGGGVYASDTSNVLIAGSTITDNASTLGGGGGIYSNAGLSYRQGSGSDTALFVVNSTISSNSSVYIGGGIGGGGITNVFGTTFHGNYARDAGGAIGSPSAAGVLRVTNSTVTGNNVGGYNGGSAIYVDDLTLNNSLVLGNLGYGSEIDRSYSGVGNIVGTGTADLASVFAETEELDGVLERASTTFTAGALADNGGPTETVALLADVSNPALDAGEDSVSLGFSLGEAAFGFDINGDGDTTDTFDSADDFTTDQRGDGFERPVDMNAAANNGSNTIDIGAVELQDQVEELESLIVTTTTDVVDATDGLTSLREAIGFINDGVFEAGSTITFDEALDGETIYLDAALGDIEISQSMIVDGSSDTTAVTINANSAADLDDADSRIFTITAGDVTTNSLYFTGGDVSAETGADGQGGAIYLASGASLSMLYGGISDNAAVQGGGVMALGDFTASGSYWSRNTATDGAGLYNAGADVTLANVSMTSNAASGQGGAILNTGTLEITSGSTADNTADQGGAIFNSGALSVDGLFADGGSATSGGAIFNSGDLVLLNASIDVAGATNGGALFNSSDAVLINSSLYQNEATESGGGIYNSGELTTVNVTLYDNASQSRGGGLYNSGTAELTNNTFALNSGSTGGGVFTIGTLTLTNTLSVDNVGYSSDDEVSGTYTDGGGNLISDGSISIADVFDNERTSNNGSYTGLLEDGVLPLLTNQLNPALDAATGALPTEADLGVDVDGDGVISDDAISLDGLGSTRDVDQTLVDNGATLDIGAVEAQDDVEAGSLIVTTVADIVDGTDGLTSLREAIAFANSATDADGDGNDVDTVTFDASVFDGVTTTITLTEGEIEINDAVIIDGDLDDDGVADVTIDADDASRIFNTTDATADTTLTGLTLTGGYTSADNADGGAVRSLAALSITDSSITDSKTTNDDASGGAVYAAQSLTIDNATFSGNSTAGDDAVGGAIHVGGDLSAVDITASSNSTSGWDAAGGAIYVAGGAYLADSGLFGNSTAGRGATGGGAHVAGDVTLNATGIVNNETLENNAMGGGLYSGGDVLLVDSGNAVISNTTAGSGSSGGGIFAVGDVTNSVGVLNLNTTSGAFAKGGGIYAGGDVYFGGAIFENTTSGYNADGGAIFGAGNVELSRVIVSGNSTTGNYASGGAVAAIGALNASYTLLSSNSTAGSNSAGGGASVGGDATFAYSMISSNATSGAFSEGGGVYATGSVTGLGATVLDNSTSGYNASGGGLRAIGAVSLTNGSVIGNSTSVSLSSGGGVSTDDNLSLINSTVTGNVTSASSSNGGGFYAGGDVSLTNSLVLGNVATESSNNNANTTTTLTGGNIVGGTFSLDGVTEQTGVEVSDVFAEVTEVTDADGAGTGVYTGVTTSVSDPADYFYLSAVPLRAVWTNPAIDAGDAPDGVSVDALLDPREFDQPNVDNGGTVDLGALELQDEIDAQSLIVTTAEDVIDGTDGVTSLREAVIFANSATDADGDGNDVDVITFDATVFDGEDVDLVRLTQGVIEITDAVLIDGDLDDDGVADVTISGDANADDLDADGLTLAEGGTGITDVDLSSAVRSDNSTIFYISDADADTSLIGLALTGGYAGDTSSSVILRGGAVRSLASLTIEDSEITGSVTTDRNGQGGGVWSNQDLTIMNSAISGNQTLGDVASGGGVNANGVLTIVNSTISDNSSISSGGGAYGGRQVYVTDSVIEGNVAADEEGGGLYSNGALTVSGSTISGNLSSDAGGGTFANSGATITDSTISDNESENGGGGIYALYSLTLLDSTVSSNRTTGTTGDGGGISANYAEVSIVNSTISNNTTYGASAKGGGIDADESPLTLVNSTVSGNRVLGGDSGAPFDGGGISSNGEYSGAIYQTGNITLVNSIVAGNLSVYGINDLYIDTTDGASVVYSGGNIVGEVFSVDGTATMSGLASSDVFATTTELLDSDGVGTGVYGGVLADNGGDVQTIALLADPTNPALDGGDDSLLSEANLSLDLNGDGDTADTLALDATGKTRAIDLEDVANNGTNTVDLGAVELLEAASLIVTTASDVVDDSDSLTSLREAIGFVNDGLFTSGSTITFDASVFDGETTDIIRLSSEIEITAAMTIDGDLDGDGVGDVIISGDANADDLDADGLTSAEGGSGVTDISLSDGLLSDNSRVFNITAADADTVLNGLTITGGYTTEDGEAGNGAGIRTLAAVTVTDSVIAGNMAAGYEADGGGIGVGDETTTDKGAITITSSEISGNHATNGGGIRHYGGDITVTESVISANVITGREASGGGLRGSYGDITIDSSTISGNLGYGLATDYSSAILVEGGALRNFAGDITITDSVVTGNGIYITDQDGIDSARLRAGAIRSSDGDVTLVGTTVSDNAAIISNITTTGNQSVRGGAIRSVADGALVLTDSVVSGNVASIVDGTAGGDLGIQGAGLRTTSVDVVLVNSTLEGNVASVTDSTVSEDLEMLGGGVRTSSGDITITNSTVAGNAAITSGVSVTGDTVVQGGGLRTSSGSVTLTNATVTGNYSSGDGGGVAISGSDGSLSVANSLILGNGAADLGDEVYAATGASQSQTGPSIVGTTLYDGAGGSSTLSGTVAEVAASVFAETTDFVDLDGDGAQGTDEPSLGTDIAGGVLADNGGTVETVALLADVANPALDAGDDSLLSESTLGVDLTGDGDTDDALSTDANGNARTTDLDDVANNGVNTVDLGAVELAELPSLIVTTTEDVVDDTDGLTSLREAIIVANSDEDESTITFASDVGEAFESDATITLTQGETLEITSDIIIDGSSAGGMVIVSGDAGGDDATTTDVNGTTITDAINNTATGDNVRVFDISAGTTSINGLTITGGSADYRGGGIQVAYGAELLLSDSSVSGNIADFDGGGVASLGASTVSNVVFDGNVALDGNGGGFFLGTDQVATLSDVIVTGNVSEDTGGGIGANSTVMLTLSNATVTENMVLGSRGDGGGVGMAGSDSLAVLTNVTIANNYAADQGGGFNLGTDGAAELTNVTIASNTSVDNGGGIVANSNTTLTLTNVTVTGNQTTDGEGGAVRTNGNVNIINSIVLGNTAQGLADETTGGDDARYVIDDGSVVGGGDSVSAVVFAETTDLNGVLAGVVADNGGDRETVALLDDASNPALDVSDFFPSLSGIDGAGQPRGVDNPSVDNGGIIDAGAFELQTGTEQTMDTQSLVVTTADESDAFDGLTSLREAVAFANSQDGVDTITFDSTVFTGGDDSLIRLTKGELVLVQGTVIDGSTGTEIVITGDANGDDTTFDGTNITDVQSSLAAGAMADNSQLFLIGDQADGTVLTDLTLTGGYSVGSTGGDGGAIYVNETTLSLSGVTLSGNYASDDGGALYTDNGGVVLSDVTITDNFAGGNGGGLFIDETSVLTNVTIARNVAAETGGGMVNRGEAYMVNATIYGNTAGETGGGIQNDATLYASNLTVSGNTAGSITAGALGGGIYTTSGDTTDLFFSLVLGNNANGVLNETDGSGTTTTISSLLTDDAALVFAETTTIGGQTAGVLADNDGDIETIALLDDLFNPALDTGNVIDLSESAIGLDLNNDGDLTDVFVYDFDARGVSAVDLPGIGTSSEDIRDLGAYELEDDLIDNSAPVAVDDTAQTDENTSVTILAATLLANDTDSDGDTPTLTGVSDAVDGTVALNSDGDVIFTPDTDFVGEASFAYTISDGNGGTDTGAVTVTVIAEPSTYFSGDFDTDADGLTFSNSDILVYDGDTLAMAFDGSDLGISSKIDGFDVIDDSTILISFAGATDLNGLGTVAENDIVQFNATTLGDDTSGAFEMYLDGSDIGLTTRGEDIDAFTMLDDGSLLLSVIGNSTLSDGTTVADEDVLVFTPTSLGDQTAGDLAMYLDGSDLGLDGTGRDIDAMSFNDSGLIVSALANFVLDDLRGKDEDTIVVTLTSTGTDSSGDFADTLLFDGSTIGFTGELTGFDLA